MSDYSPHTNPLKHDGTAQQERLLALLDPSNVELHGLDVSDWFAFAREYARLIQYHSAESPDADTIDWKGFFPEQEEIEELISRYGQGDTEPHIALFFSFLKLLEYPQQSLNKLPKRHLDFYYKQVLKLKKQPFKPDRVHVVFELAKNATKTLVEAGTNLKAGEDAEGNQRLYRTEYPLAVNNAEIAMLQAAFVDRPSGDEDGKEVLRRAPQVNSADGNGAAFENEAVWSAFGESRWPEAELGFYIASDILQMKEGTRKVELTFKFEGAGAFPDGILNRVKGRITTAEEWVELRMEASGNTWTFTLAAEEEPVAAYDEQVHEARLNVSQPVLHIAFSSAEDYGDLKKLELSKLTLEVSVSGAGSLELKNELGNLDPEKPFMPFGSHPKIGSRLSVSYPEMYGKPITGISFNVRWLGLPSSFDEHYSGYYHMMILQHQLIPIQVQPMQVKSSDVFVKGVESPSEELNSISVEMGRIDKGFTQEQIPEIEISRETKADRMPVDWLRSQFKVRIESPFYSTPEGNSGKSLFSSSELRIADLSDPQRVKKGSLDLVLQKSFYHDQYPELYVNAVVDEEKPISLPNKPYTPRLDRFTMNYTAKSERIFGNGNDTEADFSLYISYPFGVKQPASSAPAALVPPDVDKELYIGLKNAESQHNISFLFQVAEGTENPLHSTFAEHERPQWDVLNGDEWQQLKSEDFARDETNNFLNSGIVELALPAAADTDHSLFSEGLHWFRIRLKKPADAVPKFKEIHTQAVAAVLSSDGSAANHLEAGLPPQSITKLLHPKAQIKSIQQSFPSYGGRPAECDTAFYSRVSERLRHKNRAVAIWDYERLVLQHFPSLHKVKCLNHSLWDGSTLQPYSPGNVTLVLVPRISDVDSDVRLKPRVSQKLKDEVRRFVEPLNSLHAAVTIANPLYEPVLTDFKVAFKEGRDFALFRDRLERDLAKLMAPWVYEADAEIGFGGSFTEYRLVNYIENLPYVDFIENFLLLQKPFGSSEWIKKRSVTPTNSMGILVPAGSHQIDPATRQSPA